MVDEKTNLKFMSFFGEQKEEWLSQLVSSSNTGNSKESLSRLFGLIMNKFHTQWKSH